MISCKSRFELQRMRAANALVADVLGELRGIVDEGVTTRELDAIAEDRVRTAGAIPAFKGYHGYPATLCTSVNEEVVHGIPSGRRLRNGDIVSIDLGVVLNDYYGDAAVTLPVGTISEDAEMLLHVTEQALARSIAQVRLGGHVSDLGHAVQRHVEAHGYSVVREFVGHGIGTSLHEEPQVPNYGEPGQGPRLLEGMVLAIADGQHGQAGGARSARWLDRGHPGRQPRRPLRAFGGGHRGWTARVESPAPGCGRAR